VRIITSVLLLFSTVCAPLAFSQGYPTVSLGISPGAAITLGDNASYFGTLGGSAEFTFGLNGLLPFIAPRLYLGYDYIPLSTGLETAHLFNVGGGLALPLHLTKALTLSPQVLGGYDYGFISDGSAQGGGLFVKGGAQVAFALGDNFGLGLDAAYRWDVGEWSGLDASLYTEIKLAVNQRPVKGVKILAANIAPVFPALFKLYDGQSFGTLKLSNQEKSALTDVSINFFVSSYMDNPTLLLSMPKFDAGAEQDVPIKALFSEQVLKITEATKVSGKVSVSFVFNGKPYTNEFTEEIRINNRNSLTWDDTRKAATFVTPNDPLVLALSKGAIAAAADQPRGQVDKWLVAAMAMHEAIRVKGQRYSTNPNTPFGAILHNANVVDTVLFPQEELSYGAGNCSDLTVLYCSMLEALGAHTAFITIPGHIYAAVQLDIPPEQVSKIFSRPQDLIVREGAVWLPVEVTLCADSFLDAWQTGAQEWRDSSAKAETEFLPVEASWQVYEPVGQIPVLATPVKLPDGSAIGTAFSTTFKRFVDQELGPRVDEAKKAIEQHPNTPSFLNELGLVYARYGRLSEAAAQFSAASKSGDYPPATVNLANVRFLANDFKAALALYQKAAVKEPQNLTVMIGILRCDVGLQKMDEARAEYKLLKALAPSLVGEYAYLGQDSSGQATDSGATQSTDQTGSGARK
jgi:hypothetical protein